MKKIYLNGKNGKELYTIVDDDDYRKLIGKRIWSDTRGYAYLKDNKRSMHLHRYILGLKNSNLLVDHINRDTLDNRRENLRTCNRSQNLMNKPLLKRNKSGYKGVSFTKSSTKNPWVAYIKAGTLRKNLGCYPTPRAAAMAYNKAALEYHKEFAYLNIL